MRKLEFVECYTLHARIPIADMAPSASSAASYHYCRTCKDHDLGLLSSSQSIIGPRLPAFREALLSSNVVVGVESAYRFDSPNNVISGI